MPTKQSLKKGNPVKKLLTVTLATCLTIIFAFVPEGHCLKSKNLYEMLNAKEEVKVYIADITNSSGDNKADLVSLKNILENDLITRMTITFKVVPNKEKADITIGCDITEFIWKEDDPVDMLVGAAGVIMDAMVKDNYSRIQAIFTVTNSKGKRMWSKALKATITKKKISSEESMKLLNERIVKIFMRECLSKTHG